jgi:hypothetical protein
VEKQQQSLDDSGFVGFKERAIVTSGIPIKTEFPSVI